MGACKSAVLPMSLSSALPEKHSFLLAAAAAELCISRDV